MDALAANQPLTRRGIVSSLTALVVLVASVGLAIVTASNAQLALGVLTFRLLRTTCCNALAPCYRLGTRSQRAWRPR